MDTPATASRQPVAVVWESFGPTHHDRLRALARAGFDVHAIELSETSKDYIWERSESDLYRQQTLCRAGQTGRLRLALALVRACMASPARSFFFCHYERPAVFLAALCVRMRGRKAFTMLDSKFDDYPRRLPREILKALILWPYNGAMVASLRSRDYLRFLGMPAARIALGYDTIDTARLVQHAAEHHGAPAFSERPFLVVARLVPKKNIAAILHAYAAYRARSNDGRRLEIIGYGPLQPALEQRAQELGIREHVDFRGRQEIPDVAVAMKRALALVLASTEEQFGLVINEALAIGLPVIVSSNAGAVDVLVENLGNGIVIDPNNPETITRAMDHVAQDETRWAAMSHHASATASRGDAACFSDSARALIRGDVETRALP